MAFVFGVFLVFNLHWAGLLKFIIFCQAKTHFQKILDPPMIRFVFVLMFLLLCGYVESNRQAWSKGI